jgi:small conductance mechanosensitive channel
MVEYSEDFEKVKSVVQSVIDSDSRIMKKPSSTIELGALSPNGLDITVRIWVKSTDYWDVFFWMNRTVYASFNKEKIAFPSPQITIHKKEK